MSAHPQVITAAPEAEAAAALVALLARDAAPAEPPPGATAWNSHHRNLRVPLPRGRDTWRDSLRTP